IRVYDEARVKKTHSAERRLAMYCESKARSAPSTVKPIPTIPSPTLGPSSAIQSPLRIDNAGRRAAEGLFGCLAQYDHFFQRHSCWLGPIEGIFGHHLVLHSH